MNIGFYHAVNGMTSNWEHQHTLSANLSRASIPGARAELHAFGTVLNEENGVEGPVRSSKPSIQKHYDFTQGPLQASNNPYHLAIEGRAFFRIMEQDGSVSFTRNGQFVRGVDSFIRTTDGANLLNSFGAAVSIPQGSEFVLGSDGVIKIDGAEQGELGLAFFKDPGKQLQLGNYGRFKVQEEEKPALGLAPGDSLSQYRLEGSNIKPIEQMINMIQVNRAFEANQRMVKAADNTTGELLSIANS